MVFRTVGGGAAAGGATWFTAGPVNRAPTLVAGAPVAVVVALMACTVLRLTRVRASVVEPPVALIVGADPVGLVRIVVWVADHWWPGDAVIGLPQRPVKHAAVLDDQDGVAPCWPPFLAELPTTPDHHSQSPLVVVPSDGHERGTPDLLVVLGSGYEQASVPELARETAVIGVGSHRVRGGEDRAESVAGGLAATARDVFATAVEVRCGDRNPPALRVRARVFGGVAVLAAGPQKFRTGVSTATAIQTDDDVSVSALGDLRLDVGDSAVAAWSVCVADEDCPGSGYGPGCDVGVRGRSRSWPRAVRRPGGGGCSGRSAAWRAANSVVRA